MTEPAPRSFTSVGIAATVAVAAAVALAWSLSRPRAPTATFTPTPAAVAPATVPTAGAGVREYLAAGYVNAKTPISLSTPSGGLVKDVKVRNGELIKKGQLLVQLDDSGARADYVAAMAELRSAESHVATKLRLQRIGAAAPAEVKTAEGEVAMARAKLAPINARIVQAKVTSPIDGVVLERLVQPDETVAASASVLRVADLTQLSAEVDIVEEDALKIHIGQTVKVTSDVTADRSFHGKVYEIAAEVDKSRGTLLVKVELDASYPWLRPGNSVRCAFQLDSR